MIRYLLLILVSATAAVTAPLPKGARVLAIDVQEDTNSTYEDAFLLCKDLGVDEVKLSLDWDRMDSAAIYDFMIPDIINVFYPAYNMPISLIFRPVTTGATTLPPDIKHLALNDPVVITRFLALLDSIHAHTVNASVTAVFIGNEIGSYLGTDADKWAAFTELYDSARVKVKQLWGTGMETGTIGMSHAMRDPAMMPYFETLTAKSDIIGVTYYPQDDSFQVLDTTTVAGDMDALVTAYPVKPIWYTEAGYQTSALCNSNERKQAGFISEMFKAWDRHADRVHCVDFAWQSDKRESFADEQTALLQIGGGYPYLNELKAYLLSLGLRTIDGRPKAGWVRLQQEAAARGWGTPSIIRTVYTPSQPLAASGILYDIRGRQKRDISGIGLLRLPDGRFHKVLQCVQ